MNVLYESLTAKEVCQALLGLEIKVTQPDSLLAAGRKDLLWERWGWLWSRG